MSLSARCMWTDNEFLCGRKTLQYLRLKLHASPYKIQISGRTGMRLWAHDIPHTWCLWDRSTNFRYKTCGQMDSCPISHLFYKLRTKNHLQGKCSWNLFIVAHNTHTFLLFQSHVPVEGNGNFYQRVSLPACRLPEKAWRWIMYFHWHAVFCLLVHVTNCVSLI